MPEPIQSTLVDTTKTTTATSSKQSAARKGPRILTEGPSVLSTAGATWAIMTGDQRNSYAQLRADMANALEPNVPTSQSTFNTFVSLSAANIAADKPLDLTALPYKPADPMPDVNIYASYINGTLKITLSPTPNYPHPIALKAARPILAADNVYKSTAFKKIGSIQDFSGTVDITSQFLTRFRVPGTGYKIAIELMGVAPGGFHTSKLYVFGIVGNVAAEDVQADPEDGKDDSNLELG